MRPGDFIGQSTAILAMRKLLGRVARSPARAVLVYGETGTGKGLVAQNIHAGSDRAARPFIDVNCAAIPGDLFDQEMFGPEKSTLTSAILRSNGLISAARGGTLFLDEIPELDRRAQTRLLGLLERRRARRTGAAADIEVDIRFICATNRILFQEVRNGRFRDDLYFRLQVVSINIPPLRERGEDCLLLSEYFIRKFNRRYGRSLKGWEPRIGEIFSTYRWPGNVRELENLLERIFVLEQADEIRVAHIPPRIMRELEAGAPATPAAITPGALPAVPEGGSFHQATDAFQARLIRAALAQHRGSLWQAAAALGLSRHALRYQMTKLRLR